MLAVVILPPSAPAQQYFPFGHHAADTDQDWRISLSELLRVIQFYNSGGYHGCLEETEDGFVPGVGTRNCCPHHADYLPDYWRLSPTELLRIIQFYHSDGLHWLANSEDGFAPGPGPDDSAAFAWHELEPAPGQLRQLELCDLNGDGRTDVYVNSETDGLAWWEADGEGGFTRHAIHGPVWGTLLIDFDGDGATDILGPWVYEVGAPWWRNEGAGTFVEADPLTGAAARACADALRTNTAYVVDLNDDGRDDFVAGGAWWRNEGGLEFTSFPLPDEIVEYQGAGGVRALHAADLDGDGDMDLLGVGVDWDSYHHIFLLERLDETQFAYRRLLPLTLESIDGTYEINVSQPGDLDRDDLVDFLARVVPRYDRDSPGDCRDPEKFVLFRNEGDAQFAEHDFGIPLYSYSQVTFSYVALIPHLIADMDGDGNEDILFGVYAPVSRLFHLGWWQETEEGRYRAGFILSGANLRFHDFNGDGLPDIAGVNAAGALGWWENRLGQEGLQP
ncbi:MAG TPA: VCBS repeat-containing protein [Candidatus Hydrogenedentes bacterium]|nr:VCBS repeat-containing protein [Candidatus Hydrogenedentota bacterium]